MASNLFTPVLILTSLATGAVSQTPPSLKDALDSAGASDFAKFLQSDSSVWDLYSSGQAVTVFAPSDSAANKPWALQERSLSARQKQLAQYQASHAEERFADVRRGGPIKTLKKSSKLKKQEQRVVSHARPESSSGSSKRWEYDALSQRQNTANNESLLPISSGLGDLANIIKADIAFDGGVIHLTDSYFTLPQSLSSTSNTAGHTTFANLTAEGNLTNTLDNTPFVTVFVPTNEAFSAAGANATKATSSADLISNHVVQDFLGYLPALTDGLVLKSRAGQILTVSVRSGQYYVNGAKITTSNLILENGVAHVVDKVISKGSSPPPVISASVTTTDLAKLACLPLTIGGAVIVAFLAFF